MLSLLSVMFIIALIRPGFKGAKSHPKTTLIIYSNGHKQTVHTEILLQSKATSSGTLRCLLCLVTTDDEVLDAQQEKGWNITVLSLSFSIFYNF